MKGARLTLLDSEVLCLFTEHIVAAQAPPCHPSSVSQKMLWRDTKVRIVHCPLNPDFSAKSSDSDATCDGVVLCRFLSSGNRTAITTRI